MAEARGGSAGAPARPLPLPHPHPDPHTIEPPRAPYYVAAQAQAEWLQEARRELGRSAEWKRVAETMFTAVQHHLADNHTLFFSDLSDSEKTLVVDRAARLAAKTPEFQTFTARVSETLDECLNGHVNRELVAAAAAASPPTTSSTTAPNSSTSPTKVEALLRAAAEGAAGLLRTWPDLVGRLQACFNQALPQALRAAVWPLCLRHERARAEYVGHATAQRLSTVSMRDMEITQRCEALVAGHGSLAPLLGSTAHITLMKTILSYRHSRLGHLDDADYCLAAPFAAVFARPLSSPHAAGGAAAADVEAVGLVSSLYERLRGSLPPGSEGRAGRAAMVAQVVETVKVYDIELFAALTSACEPHGGLAAGLERVFAPVFERLFVTFLSLECCCFVWDQHILGLTAPRLDTVLPAYAAAVLLALRDALLLCNSYAATVAMLNSHAPKLRVRQLQRQVQLTSLEELRAQMADGGEEAVFPLMDLEAALSAVPPWSRWSAGKPVEHKSAAEKAAAIEARKLEEHRSTIARLKQDMDLRRQIEAERIEAERQRRTELMHEREKMDERLQEEQAQTRAIDSQRAELAAQLEDEVQRRTELEQSYGDQEIALLQEQRKREELEQKRFVAEQRLIAERRRTSELSRDMLDLQGSPDHHNATVRLGNTASSFQPMPSASTTLRDTMPLHNSTSLLQRTQSISHGNVKTAADTYEDVHKLVGLAMHRLRASASARARSFLVPHSEASVLPVQEEHSGLGFSVGSRAVVVNPKKPPPRKGVVRFIGKPHWEPGALWVGIEYDEAVGTHDGVGQGKRYFKCRPNRGGFARAELVRPDVGAGP